MNPQGNEFPLNWEKKREKKRGGEEQLESIHKISHGRSQWKSSHCERVPS